jgi:hypothetical protein
MKAREFGRGSRFTPKHPNIPGRLRGPYAWVPPVPNVCTLGVFASRLPEPCEQIELTFKAKRQLPADTLDSRVEVASAYAAIPNHTPINDSPSTTDRTLFRG